MHKGFTLAEVLVTLTVVGIVASMTIPSLIKNHQKSELRAGLKEGHSILSQAVNQMLADQGGGIRGRYLGNNKTFKLDFIKYFKVVQDCGWAACVPYAMDDSPIYKKYSKLSGSATSNLDEGQFVLTNGMTVFIQNSEDPTLGILLSIDVNGHQKAPNALGHDLFTFELMGNDALLPAGAEGTGVLGHWATGFATEQDTYCNPTGTHVYNGIGCTARALTDDSYWDNLP